MRLIRAVQTQQSGVFSSADLHNLLAERHPAAFARRVRALEREGLLERFMRGFYVVPGAFDLAVLSQRIAPDSYVSFGTVLAQALVVGTAPEREVWAAKMGRSREYRGAGSRIVHLGLDASLLFGYELRGGVRWALVEKALVDTLYFHLRGRRYPFDVYSDLNLDAIDKGRVLKLLRRYRNPKVVAFVRGVLDATA
jgi:hypothetical protein